jgi:hypothetical protein
VVEAHRAPASSYRRGPQDPPFPAWALITAGRPPGGALLNGAGPAEPYDGGVQVAVQTVLFENPLDAVERLVAAVDAAATAASGTARFSLYLGDCTPEPLFPPDGPAFPATAASLERIDYVPFAENLGHGRAQDRLADRHRSDVLVLLNPDSCLHPRALAELLGALTDPAVGAAEGRQIPMESPRLVSYTDGDTPWGAGCLLALRRDVFDRAGRFDPAFFLHDDDVDLCWRIRRAGYAVRYVPTAAVFHQRSIDPSGYAGSTPTEAVMMSLGEMLLMHRAGQPGQASATATDRGAAGAADHERRSARLYQEHLRDGTLPAPDSSAVAAGLLLDRRLRRF